MIIFFWIIGIIIAIYLAFVIPAGLAVLIKKNKFKKSPDRPIIEKILSEYKTRLKKMSKIELANITITKHPEIVYREGQVYSIDISAKKKNENKYRIIISVGKLSPVTIGYAEKFDIIFK